VLQPVFSVSFSTALAVAVVTASPATAAFVSDADPSSDYDRALTCLTQAISYEAGNEPTEGQYAFAQVVLNRVRHPAYPNTVCGVVYQGSMRKTGCQFTFTCDGSLKRGRSAASLSQARIVAEQVLAGRSSALVGGATHYHADYVSPYWAPSLVKVATIGAHIFYRMPGAPDSPAIVSISSLSGEPQVAATVLRVSSTSVRIKPLPTTSASAFSPWGLPVLVVSKNGTIRAAGQ
jgi:spore germination cell wall hydrolase CwlJ-like protein